MSLVVASAAILLLASASLIPADAAAQEESYAWGDPGEGDTPAESGATGDDPLRIVGYIGGGIGFRLLANLDPPFEHSFLTPGYLDLGAAVYLPGRELRHGAGLAVSVNLSNDAGRAGQRAFTQYVLTPSYQILLPLWRIMEGLGYDEVQLQIRAGIPIVIGEGLGDRARVDLAFGGEVALAVHYKFLAGFGLYAEAQVTVIGGLNDTVHPFISVDGGLMFDLEVLP